MPEDVKTVVTKREGVDSAITDAGDGSILQTIAMPAWQIVLVRTLRVYVQSLAGFLTASATGYAASVGVQVDAKSFWGLVTVSASLAVAPAVFTLLQNVGELLAKLDNVRPTFRA